MAENIFRGVVKKDATDRQVMIVARLTLIAVFMFGIIVAYDENSSIFGVVSYAWAGLGASFGPLTLCAFVLSFAAIIIVSLLTPAPSEAVANEFDHYMDEGGAAVEKVVQ